MKACEKCGNTDLLTRYVAKDTLIDSSSMRKVENEFVRSSKYDFYYSLKAKKEHLSQHCKACQYDWLEPTLEVIGND